MSSTVQAGKRQEAAAVAKSTTQATEEQRLYASILDIGMKIGLAGIITSFLVYISGVVAPKIPLRDVGLYWGMKSHDYIEKADLSAGWSWVSMYNYSDFLNFFPIAFLAGVTVICYLAIIPGLLRKKDNIYAVLALLEVLVLVGAASGLISAGGH